ncbi:hypothetical protein BDV26DRAFT_298274 [Aspergillus bertholletiae]|uniref:Uncharacterized protein n=1 Tax=Aspergillus bertholletiae TaxID=1226010 RepID=A0A5N7AQ64_9EURO|nr:hypothetical protein BDV26DRAFT_298274 [Aspergillus bertholletiae]
MYLSPFLIASTFTFFISPSLAGDVIGAVDIKTRHSYDDYNVVEDHECVKVASEVRKDPIRRIQIWSATPDSGIECTFYRFPYCGPSNDPNSRHSYTLHEGTHTFKRDFFASSFNCKEASGEYELL